MPWPDLVVCLWCDLGCRRPPPKEQFLHRSLQCALHLRGPPPNGYRSSMTAALALWPHTRAARPIRSEHIVLPPSAQPKARPHPLIRGRPVGPPPGGIEAPEGTTWKAASAAGQLAPPTQSSGTGHRQASQPAPAPPALLGCGTDHGCRPSPGPTARTSSRRTGPRPPAHPPQRRQRNGPPPKEHTIG